MHVCTAEGRGRRAGGGEQEGRSASDACRCPFAVTNCARRPEHEVERRVLHN